MPEWKRIVGERLELKGIAAEYESEVIEELAAYAEDAYRDALANGFSESDATDYALLQLGDWTCLASAFSGSSRSSLLCGAARRWDDRERPLRSRRAPVETLADISQDLRFAVRSLRRRPLFLAMAVVTLALGSGATTTVFSVSETVLLQGLPYRDADRIVSIWTERQDITGGWRTRSLYPSEHLVIEENAETLDGVALYFYASMTLRGQGHPIDLMAGEATASLADISGIRPQLGRWFQPSEVGPGATYVAVLGDTLWRSVFGADPEVIGRSIQLDGDSYTVIGVMPPEFRFEAGLHEGTRNLLNPRESGERPVWVPLGHSYGARGGPDWFYQREGWSFEAIARLRDGFTLEAAQGDVEAALRTMPPVGPLRVRLAYRDALNVAGLPAQLLLLAVPSLLLLLIACGNVATLLLGEGLNRRAEIATRTALGAGARRIVRLLLTESLLLGVCGSAGGAAIAFAATRLLVEMAPVGSAAAALEVNIGVLLFACAVGLAAGLLFGLLPAVSMGRWAKADVASRLRGRTISRSRRGVNAVIGLEVALTVVLLVTGGLLARTVWNLFDVDNGFDPKNLIALRTANDYTSRAERANVNLEIVERIQAIPGVAEATGSWSVPLMMGLWYDELEVERPGEVANGLLPMARYDIVLPNYHQVMRIPLLGGRYFTPEDGLEGAGAAIVSESIARRFWTDNGSAIGRRVRLRPDTSWSTVVGVVADVKYAGPGAAASSPVFIPYLQSPNRNGMRFAVTVRTSVDAKYIIPLLEDAAREVEPQILLKEPRLLESVIAHTTTDQRYRALIVLLFGSTAVVLAAVGIFGIVARSLTQRTREIAIRVALGARHVKLAKLILRSSLCAMTIGVISGVITALGATRLLSRFLFGVQWWDPATYATVLCMIILVCLTASYLPARRVMGIQPAEVLKGE